MSAIHKIADRSARILLIDERSTVRQILVAVLRKLGYQTFNFCNDSKEARKWIRREPVDWIIGTLKEAEGNCLELLADLYEDSRHRHVRVSLIVNGEQAKCLGAAFEFGMLSWHSSEFSFHYLETEFEELASQIKQQDYQEAAVAAHYFRKQLSVERNYVELVRLERSLAALDVHDYQQVLRLAEAQFLAGQQKAARRTLEAAQYFDPDLAEQAARMHERYVGDLSTESASFATRLGITRALIVDPDELTKINVADALRKVGIDDIVHCASGDEAWNHITTAAEPPQIIVQEWRLKGLSGPYLIQRIRGKGLHVPVIIASSALERSDAQLVKDMFVSQVLSKPLRQKQLIMAIAWALKQYREPTEGKTLERKILTALKSARREEAERYRERFLAIGEVSQSRRQFVEAAFLYDAKRYEEAVPMLIDSISAAEGDNVDATVLLSRTVMKLGDFDAATALLAKASDLSPQNIERLCDLAEVHLSAGHLEEAREKVEAAESLDAGSQRVLSAGAKYALSAADIDRAKQLIAGLDSVQDVIAFMNNRAVALIRQSDFKQGIDLYKSTLAALPKGSDDYGAVVQFNLALAHVRTSDLELAAVYVKKAIDAGDSRVYDKALQLRTRIQEAKQLGRPLMIGGQEAVLPERIRRLVHTDLLGRPPVRGTVEGRARPGEVALYGVYVEDQRTSLARRYLGGRTGGRKAS